jgi:hypothetical protein
MSWTPADGCGDALGAVGIGDLAAVIGGLPLGETSMAEALDARAALTESRQTELDNATCCYGFRSVFWRIAASGSPQLWGEAVFLPFTMGTNAECILTALEIGIITPAPFRSGSLRIRVEQMLQWAPWVNERITQAIKVSSDRGQLPATCLAADLRLASGESFAVVGGNLLLAVERMGRAQRLFTNWFEWYHIGCIPTRTSGVSQLISTGSFGTISIDHRVQAALALGWPAYRVRGTRAAVRFARNLRALLPREHGIAGLMAETHLARLFGVEPLETTMAFVVAFKRPLHKSAQWAMLGQTHMAAFVHCNAKAVLPYLPTEMLIAISRFVYS